MTAMAQVHSHNGITGLEKGEIGCHVGLTAAMRLDVGMLGLEQFFGSLNCQAFDGIYIRAAGIVAVLGVAFGIFVG